MTPELVSQLLEGKADKAALRAQLLQELMKRGAEAPTSNAEGERIERIEARGRAASRRLVALAAALGACPCLGRGRCSRCHGKGAPGWRAPDPDAFTTFVEPTLRRLGLLAEDEDLPNHQE